jgi:phosphopantothenoylcysteine decarboxylase/phosphopantothenate--cysteine ligase
MNDRMWKNAAVQENLTKVRKLGYRFVDPEEGFLACGTYAIGRLADPVKIVAAVESIIAP